MKNKLNSETTRRTFINWMLGIGATGWLGSVIFPLIKYIIPPKMPEAKVTSVKVGNVADFAKGSGTIFKYGTKPGILIRHDNGNFAAFTAICTHLDCTVQYKDDERVIWCACHNGRYDLHGKNISGPPPRPLEEYKLVIKSDEIYVTKES